MSRKQLFEIPGNPLAGQRTRPSTPWVLANQERDRQANREALLGRKATLVRGPLWAKRRGEVSELAFFYKAASLGFGVAKPWGDSERYDFIVDSGQRLWRVQVKSGAYHQNRRYGVHAMCGNREQTQYTSGEIDILAAYLIPIDVWYIIPVEKIRNRWLLFFPYGGDRCGHYEEYRGAWNVMAPETSDASLLSTGLGAGQQSGRFQPGYLDPRFL
jgi:PD-(D/E)XK nuclease superfamily protein